MLGITVLAFFLEIWIWFKQLYLIIKVTQGGLGQLIVLCRLDWSKKHITCKRTVFLCVPINYWEIIFMQASKMRVN